MKSLKHPVPPPCLDGDREIDVRPLTPALSPSEGERVPVGRVRGISDDSRKFLASAVLSLFAPLLLGAGILAVATSSQAGTITVKGSDTLLVLARKWAEVYTAKHPQTSIHVTAGDTGKGFAALQNETTDLCNASRQIKAREIEACLKAFKKRPREYKVCLDGLTIYVNAGNPVQELSIAQLEQIFTGKLRNWKEVGGPDLPITVYRRESGSGTSEFFKERVLKARDFSASAKVIPGTAALLEAVAGDPQGIGYGGSAYGTGARHLAIKKDADSPAIEPTEEAVESGRYPIWRHLYIYLNPALDKGEVAAYLRWIRSDEGQAIVKEVGYYPLPKNWRLRSDEGLPRSRDIAGATAVPAFTSSPPTSFTPR